MSTLFCRHNRFTADCAICSKDTVLDSQGVSSRTPARAAAPRPSRRAGTGAAKRVSGPFAVVGPYEDDEGARYEVRLERVPGGLRLAEWSAGTLRRRAPVLALADVAALVQSAGERAVVAERDRDQLAGALSQLPDATAGARHGASRGRSGDMSEELRVERLDAGRARVGRWTLRPGDGWLLHDAPVMMPAARYSEALGAAARAGVLAPETA